MQNKPSNKALIVSLGLAGIFCWIVLFGLGVLVDSKYYRDAVSHSFAWDVFFMSIISYTPTNLAVLSLFAAFGGGCASKLIYSGIVKKKEEEGEALPLEKTDSHIYMNENPFGSMLRGLAVYFVFLTGSYLACADPFVITSAGQYAKSAGSISLLSFFVGYDPTVFRSMLTLTGKLKSKE